MEALLTEKNRPGGAGSTKSTTKYEHLAFGGPPDRKKSIRRSWQNQKYYTIHAFGLWRLILTDFSCFWPFFFSISTIFLYFSSFCPPQGTSQKGLSPRLSQNGSKLHRIRPTEHTFGAHLKIGFFTPSSPGDARRAHFDLF